MFIKKPFLSALILSAVLLCACTNNPPASASAAVPSAASSSPSKSAAPATVFSSSFVSEKEKYVLEWGHSSPDDFPQQLPAETVLLDESTLDKVEGQWRYYPLQTEEAGTFLFGDEIIDLTFDTENSVVFFGIGSWASEYTLRHNGGFMFDKNGEIKATLYKTFSQMGEGEESVEDASTPGPEKYSFSIKVEIPPDGGDTISVTLLSCSTSYYDSILGQSLPYTKYTPA